MSDESPCYECAAARLRPWAAFRSTCDGCRARAIGRSPICWDARHALPQDDDYREARQRYRDMLEAAGITHEQVMAARAKDYQEGGT